MPRSQRLVPLQLPGLISGGVGGILHAAADEFTHHSRLVGQRQALLVQFRRIGQEVNDGGILSD
jgi:hypothetical protein